MYDDYSTFHSFLENEMRALFEMDRRTPKKSWRKDDEIYDDLLRLILKEIGKYDHRAKSFENSFGRNKHEYIGIMERWYNKQERELSRKVKRQSPKELEKERNRADKVQGYSLALSSKRFFQEVDGILEKIKVSNSNSFVISNALDKLATRKTGITRIDNENLHLLALFKKTIEIDKKNHCKKISTEVEKDISKLRKCLFYRLKKGSENILTLPDYHHLYGDSGLTFGIIFQRLRSLADYVKVETKDYAFGNNSTLSFNNKTFQEKMLSFDSDVKHISSFIAKINEEKQLYEGYLTTKEREEVSTILNGNSGLLLEIKKIETCYKKLLDNNKKYGKIIKMIEAVKNRRDAILEAREVLNDGIFPRTKEMLLEELRKCDDFLRKNDGIIKLFEKLFIELSNEIMNAESMMKSFYGIMAKGKERKKKEEDKLLRDKEETEKLAQEQKLAIIQEEINKIKFEIIRAMSWESYSPLVTFIDFDHIVEDYAAYNEAFHERLIAELNRRGIEYDGADLSNPYDFNSYKKMIEDSLNPSEMGKKSTK